ncbi:hypothetical protein A0H81_10146 [Grifola frondosa]|uniref:Uncharacterized protein n=1 Tax=Grifola frondosa TaxID=5627 RepID=A0A1C7LXU8_GRIFR|nr:hypothetical protein A0H81_10146 [Grifola frondosa]
MLAEGWDDALRNGVQRQDVDAALLVTHLASGLNAWDFVVSLSFDWSVIKSRRGSIWGILFCYSLCRYISMLSTAVTLIFIDSRPYHNFTALCYIFQVTTAISMSFAFSILTLRVVAIWKRPYISWFMTTSHLALWICVIRGFTMIHSVWINKACHIVITSVLLYESTTVLVAGIVGLVLKYRRRKASEATCFGYFRELYRQGMLYFVLIWAVVVASSIVTYAVEDPTGVISFSIGYVAYIVTVIAASRVFRDMVLKCNTCPVTSSWLIGSNCFGFGSKSPAVHAPQSDTSKGEAPMSLPFHYQHRNADLDIALSNIARPAPAQHASSAIIAFTDNTSHG